MSPADPGLQQERTSLAWRRTTISFLIVGLIVTRVALSDSALPIALLSLVVLVVAVWLVIAALRGGRWSGPHASAAGFHLVRDGRVPAIAAVVCAGLCLVVLLLSWT